MRLPFEFGDPIHKQLRRIGKADARGKAGGLRKRWAEHVFNSSDGKSQTGIVSEQDVGSAGRRCRWGGNEGLGSSVPKPGVHLQRQCFMNGMFNARLQLKELLMCHMAGL